MVKPLGKTNAIDHGECRRGKETPEYRSWSAMKARCNNPKFTGYHNWGGRGIIFCERWKKYENFLEDMGRRPTPYHTLERMDNNGNYEPGNCKWATKKEQTINSRSAKLSQEQVNKIRELYKSGKYFQRTLAMIYSVNQTTISDICRNSTW